MRLVYNGIQLDDSRLLSSYQMKDKDILHMVLRLRGGGIVKK